MAHKHRRGPWPEKDKQRVKAWYSRKGILAYEWVQRMRKLKYTWNQILGHITGGIGK